MNAPVPTPPPKRAEGPPGTRPRVCVIGAGISGLVTLRALLEAGLDCTAFELGSRVGGLWVYENDNGRSAAYRSLAINTSARAMELTDFPWPAGTPDYPGHEQVASYFDAYAERFELTRHVRFRTEVEHCAPLEGGGYAVTLHSLAEGSRRTERFDAVVVANGHHWAPSLPSPFPPGQFSGSILHSHAYRDPTTPLDLRQRRVLVVGIGNSAVDVACELAGPGAAAQVLLSTRRGAWVIPKYILGKPADQGTLVPHWLPARLRRRIVTTLFRLWFGRMRDWGLPEPDHLIGEAHPTLSSNLPALVKAGSVGIRPAIERFEGERVVFSDGRSDSIDAIVFATGYRVELPFFEAEHIAAQGNELPLFHRVFHPTHRNAFFVGLAQTIGAIMPIAELQARWIVEHLSGRYSLPEAPELDRQLAAQRRVVHERYVSSARHTMQIDPPLYLRAVRAEMKRGSARARRGQGQPFLLASPGPAIPR
ncbi:MAG TPA: NAD(P)-binding domain-containing protein [Polyangiaceae bacterium]|nr:NAD(P)-binding domain-containing protein [Polyangiaceae bacterium]